MGDKIINQNLQNDQEQETESEETLSLTDFLVTQDQDQRINPPSLPTEELFEFFQGQFCNFTDENMMSHAEDIIFCGKLIPKKPPQQKQKSNQQQQQPSTVCRRSESMSEVKTTTTTPPSQLVRNSKSLDYKKLNRNSSMSSELKKSSSSSRWYVLLFGLVKVPPPEMDLRDMKSRQVRRSSSKTLFVSTESCDAVQVNESDKCSWRLLGFLSCKSSANTAATTPLRYIPKV